MRQYRYDGSVSVNGKIYTQSFVATTYACSADKAMANIKYQFRKKKNFRKDIPIELNGRLS